MASAETTRLRVAQAARIPVTAEQVAGQLATDEAAVNLSPAKVTEAMAEWIKLGIVEELPAASEDAPVRYVHSPVWTTELHRRIAGHLLRPRGLASLQAETRSDPQVGSFDLDTLAQYVGVLEKQGLVKNIGTQEDSTELADRIDDDDDVIDLHPSSRKILVQRLAATDPVTGNLLRGWELEGDFFVLTRKGLDALQVT